MADEIKQMGCFEDHPISVAAFVDVENPQLAISGTQGLVGPNIGHELGELTNGIVPLTSIDNHGPRHRMYAVYSIFM